MVEVSKHPKIRLMTYSEIQDVSGYVGNFKVKILKKPTYVDPAKCTLCDECTKVCPIVVPNEFDLGLTGRRAIYIPFPQAIPASYTLDDKNCPDPFTTIACGKCADVCKPKAIDFDQKPEIIEEEVGAIIVATGYDLYDKENMAEYGFGKYADVLDGLQFERLCSASGPTMGQILRPSDHKEPKEVVFIQCSGSRDPENHCAYCSKICCMYTAKHAMLYKHHVHDGQAYVFYIDIRSGGKGYEEFVQRAIEEDGVVYLRGKVSKIFEDNGKIIVWGVDTLTGKHIEIDADMVVLAQAMRPSTGAQELAKKLKLAMDKDGFLAEAHPKLRPVESVTSGMFLAGAAQAPKDIPEAVAQASGAAAKAITILSQERLFHSPTVARVIHNLCTGCGMCVAVCPYDTLSLKDGKVEVNEVLCEGCGSCTATCLRSAIQVKNLTQQQVAEMINACLGG
jgi:heterodisulfide reductase subunit A